MSVPFLWVPCDTMRGCGPKGGAAHVSWGINTTMCDVPADCLGVSLDELHAMGVRLAMADWLPTPSMLIPSRNLALMDSRLDSEQRQATLASLVDRGLDRLNPPV